MPPTAQELESQRGLILHDVVQFQFEVIADAAPTPGAPAALAYLRAVGAVSDVRYQSGRVIPSQVQAAGIADAKAKGRQMTMYIGHPQGGVDVTWESAFTGKIEDCAAIIEEYHFDSVTRQTVLDRIRVLDTKKGEDLVRLAKAGVKLGVSQRATGRWEEKDLEIGGQWVPALIVTEFYGIWGWDAVHLPVANAGDVTMLQLTDSVINGGRGRLEKTMPDANPTETPQSKAFGQSILDMLDNAQKRADYVLPLLKLSVEDQMKVREPLYQYRAECKVLMDSSEPEDQKMTKLGALGKLVSDAYQAIPAEPRPQATTTPAPAAQVSQPPAFKSVFDQAFERERQADHLAGLKRYGAELLAAETKIPEEDRARVQALVDSVAGPHMTREQVKSLVDGQVDQLHKIAARVQQASQGYQPQGRGITDSGNGANPSGSVGAGAEGHVFDSVRHLDGARLLFDTLVARGGWTPSQRKRDDVHPSVRKIIDQYVKLHGRELFEESAKLGAIRGSNGLISDQLMLDDASMKADFNTPATLSLLILAEVYALPLFRELTQMGTMVSQVDQVPIKRWRGDGNAKTFKPTIAQRYKVRGERVPIPKGRLFVDFVTLTALGRKLGTSMTLEFLTRAKRHPDITGLGLAISALTENMQRILQQDVFDEMYWAAAMHGSETIDVLKSGDGAEDTFQIVGTTIADAVTLVPNKGVGQAGRNSELIVEVGTTSGNRTAVPEYGTTDVGGGPGGTFFYIVNHAASTISFVDADGAALAPANSPDNIRVRGRKASAEKRFDLKLPNNVTQEQHMLSLLFEVSNLRAKLSSGGITDVGYYDADFLLASVTNTEFMKQASSYAMLNARNAYRADGEVREGNYGVTAGLGHWGSKVHADDRMIIGNRMGTLFYQYEPMSLHGPVEAVNSSGELIGEQEYYTYGEDAIDTPIEAKFALITPYRSA
jgi:hypothetical protein